MQSTWSQVPRDDKSFSAGAAKQVVPAMGSLRRRRGSKKENQAIRREGQEKPVSCCRRPLSSEGYWPELIEVADSGGVQHMTRWEALVRKIYTMSLNKDPAATRLLQGLRVNFQAAHRPAIQWFGCLAIAK